MLTVLMTSVTKGAHSVNEIVDKVSTSCFLQFCVCPWIDQVSSALYLNAIIRLMALLSSH